MFDEPGQQYKYPGNQSLQSAEDCGQEVGRAGQGQRQERPGMESFDVTLLSDEPIAMEAMEGKNLVMKSPGDVLLMLTNSY